MARKGFIKQHTREITLIGVIVVCVILLAVSMLLVNGYTSILDEQVKTKVEQFSGVTDDLLKDTVDRYESVAAYASGKLQSAKSEGEIISTINGFATDGYMNSPVPKGYRYYKDGIIYSETGDIYYKDGVIYTMSYGEKNVVDPELTIATSDKLASSGIIQDYESNMPVYAFSSPVRGNPYIDSIIIYYAQRDLTSFGSEASGENIEKSEFIALCQPDGTIITTVANKGFIDANTNVIDSLRKIANTATIYKDIPDIVSGAKSGPISFSVSGTTYWVSVSSDADELGFVLFSIYRSDVVFVTGYEFVNVVITSIIVLLILLILFAVYLIISRRIMAKKIENFGTYDDELDCFTYLGFEREAQKMLDLHKATHFAVIVCDINHYKYIYETYGKDVSDEILTYLRTLYKKSMQQGELFGHVEDSQFVLLFHYREMQILMNRLQSIYTIALANVNTKKYNLRLDFGIYTAQEGDKEVKQMFSNALTAKKAELHGVVQTNFKLYNEIFKEQYMQEADVEIRMDAALANNEFKVFFQPKLNLLTSKIDGCEALVRWYDSEKDYYRSPGTFLPLFEANGFIAKLDKYIYYKVCEFIGNRLSHGLKVYPTSVNISRLTAQLDDFLEYYTSTKKQFNIPDDFITLEFTESVAYENYDMLNRIAKVLHSNGFHCSIDDFGAGYSSFNLLKNMDMDEIKLDKFFLEKGLNAERDKTIWESVIKLGNELNMKVTQEGVETQDIMLYLKRIGCHVVQGYYFSKPLNMADYITFIEKSEQEEYKYLDNLGLADQM